MLDATTDLKSLLNDPGLLATRAYIGGQWVAGDAGTFPVTNPARGDVIAEVADLSRAQVAHAIDQARDRAKAMGRPDRQGTCRNNAPLVRSDDRERR